jgi:hypothetical protein
MKEIKVARYRNTPYVFNYITNGGQKRYEWSGSKGSKIDIKSLPEEAVNYLLMNSICFDEGELIIIEDTEDAKEMASNIGNLENYENNAHTREEVIELLKGAIKVLKEEIAKITNKQELLFMVDVAKEIKLDSSSKQKVLADALNVPVDILFATEEITE